MFERYLEGGFEHELRGGKDYVGAPKPDGYRGVHLIYSYKGSPQTAAYNGLRIEVQIRSLNQHAWATAVEAAGTFTKQALKSNQGSDEWKRFFKLMGSAIAEMERCPPVPDAPTGAALREELAHLSKKLNVVSVLEGFTATLNKAGTSPNAKYFLMQLEPAAKTLAIRSFRASESQRANAEYTSAEQESKSRPDAQVVLVSVESIKALKRAYPNYFLDTRHFVKLLRGVLDAN